MLFQLSRLPIPGAYQPVQIENQLNIFPAAALSFTETNNYH